MNFFRKEKFLGKARGRYRYDLPLNKDSGTGFLTLLIALMSFLTVLALSSSFALSAMMVRWTTGLENRATVEIPATDENGNMLARDEIRTLTSRAARQLETHPAVADLPILEDEEIIALIEPWLGSNALNQDIPIPGLISLTLQNSSEEKTLTVLKRQIKSIHPHAQIDTHDDWLTDLLRFTNSLRFASLLIVVIIGTTMVVAVAGAIRSRMAVYSNEVELLHLMGAADRYIARQFQRQSVILAIQGGLAGLASAALAIAIIGWLAGEMEANLLPEFTLSLPQIFTLSSIPLLVAILAYLTAGHTVRRVLTMLP